MTLAKRPRTQRLYDRSYTTIGRVWNSVSATRLPTCTRTTQTLDRFGAITVISAAANSCRLSPACVLRKQESPGAYTVTVGWFRFKKAPHGLPRMKKKKKSGQSPIFDNLGTCLLSTAEVRGAEPYVDCSSLRLFMCKKIRLGAADGNRKKSKARHRETSRIRPTYCCCRDKRDSCQSQHAMERLIAHR